MFALININTTVEGSLRYHIKLYNNIHNIIMVIDNIKWQTQYLRIVRKKFFFSFVMCCGNGKNQQTTIFEHILLFTLCMNLSFFVKL